MFSSHRPHVIIGLALALLATPALAADQQPPKWGASIDFEGKLGTERHLGEADLFVPLAQDDRTLFFGNARFRIDDSDSKEGNFGLGLRHMHASGWNGGVYGYFDRRETTHDNDFNQLTFGAEALGTDFDFRANSYWPIGDTTKNADALSTATLSGTSVIFRGGEERAFRGFDAEAGWRVPVFQFDSPYDFRVYGGGFHFYDPDDVAPDVTGPRLRAEFTSYEVPNLTKGTRVTVGAEWQNDDVRGSQAFGSLRLRIPLQSENQRNRQLTAQERRMTTPIVRDIDIVAQAGAYGAAETATQTASGTTFTVINSDSTTNLTNAVNALGANSTALLAGSFSTATTVSLANSKSLIAGDVTVRAPSGRTAVLSSPAVISSTVVGPTGTIEAPGNNTISGLTINVTANAANNAYAIVMNTLGDNYNISSNTISVTQGNVGGSSIGIFSDRNDNAVISGNIITTRGGVTSRSVATNSSTNITLSGNTFDSSGATTNNNAVVLGGTTFNAGSTGNVLIAGNCTGTAGSGFIGFTNGTTCQ